tara:strand:- start:345 stop:722 length:378 start_codon:yes stop_codon:yes gene_type:complete
MCGADDCLSCYPSLYVQKEVIVKAIKISTDGTVELLEIPSNLVSLQSQVEGFIEFLDVDGRLAAIINEEGKLTGLPYNPTATAFAQKHCGIAPKDTIVGNMLLVGSTDEGDTTDVPDTAMELLQG